MLLLYKMKIFEMFNEVGVDGGITVDGVRTFLNANKNQDITFKIATLGGDLGESLTIFNLIKEHSGKTIADIIGLTASAGTIIAMACDEIMMNDNALFLVHNGWTSVTGNVYDLQKMAADLAKNDALMIKIYSEKTGMKDEDIRAIMKQADWMSSDEALKYGFVDKIKPSDYKIAASALIHDVQGKINDQLLIKLKDKMKIFGKEKKDVPIVNVLALKDGKQMLINADVPATGVEIAPVGAATLEDGEFELADGRKITVAGGVITAVSESAVPEMAKEETEAIVAAVGKIITEEVDKVNAEINKIKADMAKISSTHIPSKGKDIGQKEGPQLSVFSKVQQVTQGIYDEIEKKRKA